MPRKDSQTYLNLAIRKIRLTIERSLVTIICALGFASIGIAVALIFVLKK